MIGGNIPGRTRTASISIYDAVAAMDYSLANQTSLFLLAVCFIALVITYSLRRGTLPA
jgi:molybdate transport system permease protein